MSDNGKDQDITMLPGDEFSSESSEDEDYFGATVPVLHPSSWGLEKEDSKDPNVLIVRDSNGTILFDGNCCLNGKHVKVPHGMGLAYENYFGSSNRVSRLCEYDNGKFVRVHKLFANQMMIEYNGRGSPIYKGGYILVGRYQYSRHGIGQMYDSEGKVSQSGIWLNGEFNNRLSGMSSVKSSSLIISSTSESKPIDPVPQEPVGYHMRSHLLSSVEKESVGNMNTRFSFGFVKPPPVLDVSRMKQLTCLVIDHHMFVRVSSFILCEVPSLQSIHIGANCFNPLDSDLSEAKVSGVCRIAQCPKLKELVIGINSFIPYSSLEIQQDYYIQRLFLGFDATRSVQSDMDRLRNSKTKEPNSTSLLSQSCFSKVDDLSLFELPDLSQIYIGPDCLCSCKSLHLSSLSSLKSLIVLENALIQCTHLDLMCLASLEMVLIEPNAFNESKFDVTCTNVNLTNDLQLDRARKHVRRAIVKKFNDYD